MQIFDPGGVREADGLPIPPSLRDSNVYKLPYPALKRGANELCAFGAMLAAAAGL